MNLLAFLKIEPGEGAKIASFVLLAGLLQAGVSIGTSTADAFFLLRLGARMLPWVFLLTPVMMAVYIPIYSYLLARIGIDRVFRGMTVALILGGGLLWGGLTFFPSSVLIFACKLYATLCFFVVYSLFWSFTEGYFAIIDAKRLYSVIMGGNSLGAILGGALVALSVRFVAPSVLFLGWSLLSALALPVLLFILKRYPKLECETEIEEEAQDLLAQTAGVFRAIRQSRYSLFLLLLMVSTLLLSTLCEFQYLGILGEKTSQAQLVSILGALCIGANVFNLGMNFFFYNRLVMRFGVANLVPIQGTVFLVAFALLAMVPGFGAAAFGYFACQGVMASVEYNNNNLLFNAVPGEAKMQVRAFLEDLGEPVAVALGGLLLVLLAGMDPRWLAFYGALGTLVCLLWGMLLRGDYGGALSRNLKREWLDFTRSSPLERLSGQEKSRLHNYALSPDLETALFAQQLLRRDPPESFDQALELQAMFERCHRFDPHEEREMGARLRLLGMKSVPTLVAVFEDSSGTFAARGMAGRTLGAIAPALFEALAPRIVETELAGPTLVGKLDFVLEILSIGGRLPAFELLSASLRSKNTKVRSNALETLAQGVDYRVFLRLRNMLEGEPT